MSQALRRPRGLPPSTPRQMGLTTHRSIDRGQGGVTCRALLSGARKSRLEFFQHLVETETCRLLARRKLAQALDHL